MEFEQYIDRPGLNFGLVCVFSFAIAVMLWSLSDGPFWSYLVISLCIGCSICLSFIFLGRFMLQFFSPYVGAIPITAIGLAVGMLLGGTLVLGRPLFFFAEDYSTLLLGVFFGVLGFVIFSTRARLQDTAAQLAQAQLKTVQQEKALAETELKLLQAQIEPHFLFNTLSNVASLIRPDPDTAEKTLLNLTTLLRASLNRTRQGNTTFGQELDIAEAYLEINAIRMHNRLTYEIDVPEHLKSQPLSPLLVQPLIENAIKHGIDPQEDGGEIYLSAQESGGNLVIEVRDTGQGLNAAAESQQAGTGTGLQNVSERLRALYADRAELRITEQKGKPGVNATLILPLACQDEPQ